MKKNSFKPTGILAHYIDRYYIVEESKAVDFNLPIVLPGTGLELVFHLNETLSVQKKQLEKAHIICPRNTFDFDKTKSVYYISVRFKSGTFRHFTPIPFSELNDTYLSVSEIWGIEGNQLLDKLEQVELISEKIKIISDFLLKQFMRFFNPVNKKWDRIIADLYNQYKTVSIYEISKNQNTSTRQFERNFKNQFGITAKKFQRITRLQDITKKILLKKTGHTMDAIFDCGYYDQSHFINEFKGFVNISPSNYFTPETFDNNFYFEPINKK